MTSIIEKYLIKTNIWVALCFTGLIIFFQLGLYYPIPSIWGIAFFGTLAIYNFTRIPSFEEVLALKKKYYPRLILTIIGIIGALIFLFIRGFEIKTFLYLFVLGFLSFCYSLPFSGLGLRTIPFIKLFLIAFVWAGSSIGLLLVAHQDIFQYKFLFLSVFLFVVGITIPFDIRDADSDEIELKTIPQVIGIGKAKSMAVICLLLSGFFFYLEFPEGHELVWIWMLTIFISLMLTLNASPKKSDFYYSFWMEACSIVPLIFYLASHLI